MRSSLYAALLCMMLGVTGCASIVSGANQSLAVETRLNGNPLPGASCKLTSNKGTWFVNTPGSVVVHRGFQDLAVECTKPGVEPAIALVASSTKAMAFGNIIFGGIIGAGVDIGTGAAYDYPPLISVEMVNTKTSDSAPVVAPSTAATLPSPAVAVVTPVAPTVVASAPIALAPRVPASVEQPIVVAPVSPPLGSRKESKYQISAETFAKTQACATQPQAVLSASGPGSETYTIPCASGEALIARCEFGNCRALK